MADNQAFRDDLLQAIDRHDRPGAVSLAVGALQERSISVAALYEILSELLVDVGLGWQRGSTEVWQEHLVTGIVRSIVEASLLQVEERAADHRVAVVLLAAPEDEYHDLGLRMLADRFTLRGWRAHFLGGALPVAEAVAAAEELSADAFALTASTHFHRLALRTYIDKLVASHPGLRVWVGGAAFAHEHDGWPDEMVLDPRRVPSPEEL